MWNELGITWSQLWLTVVSAVGVYVGILVLSRIFGQRQFASSSTYDLAFNFAMGSLIGRTLLVRVSLLNALVALSVMFVLHAATGWMHHHIQVVHDLIQNQPVMLAAHGHILDEALRRTGTSRSEVYQAVRLKGFGSLDEVAAVVLERNGQFSVVSRSQRLDEDAFAEVVGAPR